MTPPLHDLLADLRKLDADLTRWRISAGRMSGASAQGRLQVDDRIRRLEGDRLALARQIERMKAEASAP